MNRKKMLGAFALTVILAGSFQTAAFAAPASPVTCTVAGCEQTCVHTHDGVTCAGHAVGDGHAYHSVCTLGDCTETGIHAHDGQTYFGHCDGTCPNQADCPGSCGDASICTGHHHGYAAGGTTTAPTASGHHSSGRRGSHHGGRHH